MLIRINTVTGVKEHDLRNINELNHYIGMKLIDPDVIPELKYFPWVVAALIALGLVAALWGKRALLAGWAASFALAAMAVYEAYRRRGAAAPSGSGGARREVAWRSPRSTA
jgi:copper chaperone NosL